MKNNILGQLDFFDELQKELASEHPVVLDNACEWKKGELHEYKINTTYSDVVLLISMLHEYIELLNGTDGVRMEYYRNRFKAITEYLEKGIDYDYQEHLEKCHKKADKDDRLDENWIGR